MGLVSIVEYLEKKTILVTGSTGFLGKIFVEKVLRAQPNVKKLFLLLRAADGKAADVRMREEVIGKELFNVLREKHGEGFESFISDKVCAVAGDVTDQHYLGIDEPSLLELMWAEIDIVVHIAATTKFDERYDVALGINTLGAKHIMDFSKQCSRLGMLLHVSTAYVAGEKSGVILEKPFRMGEALNGGPDLDIEVETKLARERVDELRRAGETKTAQRIAMKRLGIERARKYGWPNTYVFTKSMGEMIVEKSKGNLPVAIMRPTIIASTYKEPFPGWVEGNRTIDSFITGYVKGNLKFILGDRELILDVAPGDMVVNAMLGIMVTHSCGQEGLVYHVGSSTRNPVRYGLFEESGYRYLSSEQYLGRTQRHSRIRPIRFYTTKQQFRFRMKLSYKLPLEVLRLVEGASCKLLGDKYAKLNKKYNYMMRLADLYESYSLFKGIFDNQNLTRLISAMEGDATQQMLFDFDMKNIDWEDYFTNIHIPSVIRHMDK